MSKKVLVTGGTGYIGSHTVVELQEAGYEVCIIDNLSNSEKSVLNRISKITGIKPVFEELDLCDLEGVKDFFSRQNELVAVVHFAAYKSVGESVANPFKYYNNNLVSLLNLIEAMSQSGVQNLVFSSSCTVYGEPDTLPVKENMPVKEAVSPYGNTKQIGEEILSDSVKARMINGAVSLRYFNPIGAHPTALIGEQPGGEPENLVPVITRTAIGHQESFNVYGDDYNTPDGTCIRDYLHVVDLAKAHVSALERLIAGRNKHPYEVFNLGTGKGVSVFEAISSFEKVTGISLNYRIVNRRAGDIEKIWADPGLANRELGWKTEFTLDDAMRSAWEWEKNIKNISR